MIKRKKKCKLYESHGVSKKALAQHKCRGCPRPWYSVRILINKILIQFISLFLLVRYGILLSDHEIRNNNVILFKFLIIGFDLGREISVKSMKSSILQLVSYTIVTKIFLKWYSSSSSHSVHFDLLLGVFLFCFAPIITVLYHPHPAF